MDTNIYSTIFLSFFGIIIFLTIIIGVLKSRRRIIEVPVSIFPLPPLVLPEPKDVKLLCLSGGGITALSGQAAITGAVLGRLNRGKDGVDKIRLRDHLNGYDIMSGISGGSWFMTALSYSTRFYNMLDREADGKSMYYEYEDCYSTTPLDIDTKKCIGYGVSNCQYNDESKCCCDIGFSLSEDKKVCNICNTDGLTFSNYISTLTNYGKAILYMNNPKISEAEDMNEMLRRIVPGYLYPVFGILNDTTTYDDFLLYYLFGSLSDIDRTTKVEDNPNGLTNSVIWGSSIMKNSFISGKYGSNKMVTYTINGRECKGDDTSVNCGASAAPVMMGYDYGKKQQMGSIYEGKHQLNINYRLDDTQKTSTHRLSDHLKDVDITGESVISMCTASGAAISFLSSRELIDSTIDRLDSFTRDLIQYSEKAYCAFNTTDSICGISAYVSSKFSHFAPVFKTNKKRSGFVCEGENDRCTRVTKDSYSVMWDRDITEDIPVRFMDGAFADNTGIANAVSKFQKTDNKGVCRIVSLKLIQSSKEIFYGTSSSMLFGITGGCVPLNGSNPNNVKWESGDLVPLISPKIFNSRGCSNRRRLYSSPTITTCTGNCVQLIIDAFHDVDTVDNKDFGVKRGTTCELFVVGFVMSPFVFPTFDGWSESSDDYHNNAIVKQSKMLYEYVNEIPQPIFDIVFGDKKYNP